MTKNFFLFFGSFWAQKFFPVILGRKNNFVILSQKILFGHNDLFHWAKKRPKMTQNFFGQKRQNFGSFWAKRISVAQMAQERGGGGGGGGRGGRGGRRGGGGGLVIVVIN